ncbi:hypothetical protein AB0M28_29115 [Streptomyces sp. NPDC051940]|uniref:hypothetical protein n=1 Tax=Streptomyces sp. NPDC051940 TaxID=3155675 RepID=UPI003419F1B4
MQRGEWFPCRTSSPPVTGISTAPISAAAVHEDEKALGSAPYTLTEAELAGLLPAEGSR